MARPPAEIAGLARDFVCVRVVDLRELDLARYRFDFDLTFAALTCDADGAIYHRYGGRDPRDPQSALSMESLAAFLRGSLAAHRARAGRRPPADLPPPRTVSDIPAFRARDREKRVDCVHCHTVNDFEYRQAVDEGTWKRDRMWVFPDPARLGLEVERDDQQRIARVADGSPAAKAGVRAGDRIVELHGQPILTRADLQWVLHGLPHEAVAPQLAIERPGAEGADAQGTVELALASGWKRAPVLEYAWRPIKWNLPPHPGFGGRFLPADEKSRLGLADGAYAQRIDYLVTWGDQAHTGRNAQKAGLRKGDVVVAVDGRADFESENHFQAWFRLTREVGREVEIAILRDGARRTLRMKVIE